jgi:hypothetical protein
LRGEKRDVHPGHFFKTSSTKKSFVSSSPNHFIRRRFIIVFTCESSQLGLAWVHDPMMLAYVRRRMASCACTCGQSCPNRCTVWDLSATNACKSHYFCKHSVILACVKRISNTYGHSSFVLTRPSRRLDRLPAAVFTVEARTEACSRASSSDCCNGLQHRRGQRVRCLSISGLRTGPIFGEW